MKKTLRIALVTLTSLLVIIFAMQAITPVYDFQEPRPFSGDSLYNPYEGIDEAQFGENFVKANFHAHQSLLNGNVDFWAYSPSEFAQLYREMGYDVALISDHQYINPHSALPIYEHGFNFSNYHIQCYNAQSVWWFDLPFMFRPTDQMQFFMNSLHGELPLIGLNHPSRLRMVTKPEHVTSLVGFDVIEMDHRGGGSAWDYSLSNGYYSTLTCNDDAHSRDSLGHRFQNRYTMVDIDTANLGDVFDRLRSGRSYGVELTAGISPRGAKTEPRLSSVAVSGDTLRVALPSMFDSIKFIGQNGVVRHRVLAAQDSASYVFTPQDTYIRTEIYLPNAVIVWLNPIARLSALDKWELPVVNTPLTILNSLVWLIFAIALAMACRKIIRAKLR